MSGADAADMKQIGADRAQDRRDAVELFRAGADHDGDGAVAGAFPAAADRRIDQFDAALCKLGGHGAGRNRIAAGLVDDQGSGLDRVGETVLAEDDVADLRRCWQAEQNRVAAGAKIGQAAAGGRTCRDHALHRGFAEVVDQQ